MSQSPRLDYKPQPQIDEKQYGTPAWAEMPASNCFRRYWKALAVATLLLLASLHFSFKIQSRILTPSHTFVSTAPDTHPAPLEPRALAFWDLLARAIDNGRPSFTDIQRIGDPKILQYEPDNADIPEYVDDVMEMSDEQVAELKAKHTDAKADFEKIAPFLPFVRGTRGIVITAPQNAFVILATSLRVMRLSGTTLPVEIWMYNRDNYDPYPCEHIFPLYNARCMFMTDYMPQEMEVPLLKDIGKMTFINKIAAVLFSTFEQILFLDNDAFPVNRADSIFTSGPFVDTGYVLWPDYWSVTSSQKFWDITGGERAPTTLRASTESGEMLINKATHAETLLMALYYNIYGKGLFYPLLSQGGQGEGDKETWQAAALAMDQPFYQINEAPRHAGYRCGEKKINEVPLGSIVADPRDDALIVAAGTDRNRRQGRFISQAPAPRPLFVHANLPKLDAGLWLGWGSGEEETGWIDLRRCTGGRGAAHRMWGPQEFTEARYGWDVEKAIWDSMRLTACEHYDHYGMLANGSLYRQPHKGGKQGLCRDFVSLYEETMPDAVYDGSVPVIGARKERPWGGLALKAS